MMNGEFKCCLELLIVCIERIKIDFSGTDSVLFVGEVKIEMLKFNFLKMNSNDDGEF